MLQHRRGVEFRLESGEVIGVEPQAQVILGAEKGKHISVQTGIGHFLAFERKPMLAKICLKEGELLTAIQDYPTSSPASAASIRDTVSSTP